MDTSSVLHAFPITSFEKCPAVDNLRDIVKRLRDLCQSISLDDIDMTNYLTALEPGSNPESNNVKKQILQLWESLFEPAKVQHLHQIKTSHDEPLKIVILGGGIAGSAALAAAAKAGHNVTLIESRDGVSTRENLVTINDKARPVIERLVDNTKANLLQTAGDIGCSERAPIKDIETAFQNSALQSTNSRIIRNTTAESILPAASIKDPGQHVRQTKVDLKLLDRSGKVSNLKDIDLVVATTGAKTASPFGQQAKHIAKNFAFQKFDQAFCALGFVKYRFRVSALDDIPQPREINRHRMNAEDQPIGASFVNMYTGRVLQDGDQLFFETSLLFDCPVSWAKDANQCELSQHLKILGQQFAKDNDPQVKQLGVSLLNDVTQGSACDRHQQNIKVQQGVAVVSHWMAEKAYSDRLPLISVGDAMCPANPWTGTGSNLAIQAIESLEYLMQDLAALKATHNTSSEASEKVFQDFELEVKPLRMQALLRGTFASAIFARVHSQHSNIAG